MSAEPISAHPLSWPVGWKRTPVGWRRAGKFGRARKQKLDGSYESPRPVTLAEAVDRALAELQRMGIDRQDVVISTNVRLRLDGLPRSGEPEPDDPGAAVYWQEPVGAPRVMAIDQYTKVADNLAAIAATLDAMRAIERHGGATILERAFTGFVALPAPKGSDWWAVLGCEPTATLEQARVAYRKAASAAHPDRPGGSEDQMARVNAAWERAQEAAR